MGKKRRAPPPAAATTGEANKRHNKSDDTPPSASTAPAAASRATTTTNIKVQSRSPPPPPPLSSSSSSSSSYSSSSSSPSTSSHARRNTKKKSNNANGSNPSIPISKSDHDSTLALLRSMDWEMAKNTSRRNVIRHDDPSTPRNRMNKPYCMSFIFGRNMKDPDGSMSYWSAKYPQVYSKLRDLMARYDRDFGYTHITLNRNLRCKRHTDGGNAGPSYIAGFGDYRGGGLLVEPPGGGGSSDETTVLDLRGRFVTFNGKTQPHETLAFEGERFTLVYYTSDIKSGGGGSEGTTTGTFADRRRGGITAASAEGVSSDMAAKFNEIKARLGKKK